MNCPHTSFRADVKVHRNEHDGHVQYAGEMSVVCEQCGAPCLLKPASPDDAWRMAFDLTPADRPQ